MISLSETLVRFRLRMMWAWARAICGLSDELQTIEFRRWKDRISVQIGVVPPGSKELVIFSGTSLKSIGEAFSKAYSEFLEAHTIWNLGLDWQESRSGFGAGPTFDFAFRSAKLELLERDAFLQHFLQPELHARVLPLSPFDDATAVVLQSSSATINVVMACRDNASGGVSIGLGTDSELTAATAKALSELDIISRFTPSESVDTPRRRTFSKHWRVSQTTEIRKRIDLILQGGRELEPRRQILAPTFRMRTHRTYSSNHHVVGLESDQLIPLLFGDRWMGSESKVRNILLARGISFAEFPLHPLL